MITDAALGRSVKWLCALDYLTEEHRGFWERRGNHTVGDPWWEQRRAHQESGGTACG